VSASKSLSLGADPGEPEHPLARAEVLAAVGGPRRAHILAAARLTRDRPDSYLTELHDHLAKRGTLTCPPAIWQASGIEQ
jgi:hypothetical protein